MEHVFPPMLVKPASAELIASELLRAKLLVKRMPYDNRQFTYLCNALDSVEGRKAIAYVQELIYPHTNVYKWWVHAWTAKSSKFSPVGYDAEQAYRHAWIDHMVKELSA